MMYLENPQAQTYVLFEADDSDVGLGRVLGFATAQIIGKGSHTTLLFLETFEKGLGYGRRMVEHMQAIAAMAGKPLLAHYPNSESISFWEHMGVPVEIPEHVQQDIDEEKIACIMHNIFSK